MAEIPELLTTVTSTVPAEWVGVVATIVPSLLTVNDGAGVLPNKRSVAPRKRLPVRVMTSPPPVEPVD